MPQTHEHVTPIAPVDRPESGTQVSLKLDSIDDNPYQPRLTYDEQHITELADGIRRDGLLSPIVVRPNPRTPGRYQVLAGHCRLRAFRWLLDRSDAAEERRFERIPALLRTHVTDEEMARLAINENLQRRDLSPTDAALALANYRKMMGLKTARDVARAMDLDENRVKRLLRLHDAPPFIKAAVGEGILIDLASTSTSTGTSGQAGTTKRKRQTLDLMGALEFARMFRIFYAHDPERAEKRVRGSIDKALREGWAFRRIEAFVDEQLRTGGADESSDTNNAKTSEAPATKPIFAMKANVLTVDVGRSGELPEDQQAALTVLLRGLFPATRH